MPQSPIPEDGHRLADDVFILGKLLAQFVGQELPEFADGQIDLRIVSKQIEKLSDYLLGEIRFDDEFIFSIASKWVPFSLLLGARRIIAI